MRSNSRIIVAIVCLVLPILACQAMMSGGMNSLPLSDEFSSSKWGTGTDADRSIEYANHALQMKVFKKNHFVWSLPNDESYQNVHIEVTAINNDTHETTAFGIMCDKQPGANDFYYGAITPARQYVIAKASDGQSDVFLTNDNQWSASEEIAENASSYRLGMDCGNGALTLYVDGKQLASISDASYTSGGVALFTWSGEDSPKTDVAFDDFLVMALP